MLLNLHITNYALIEDLELNLNQGFSIITGETGAGKSILLGALGLLTGKRADVEVIRVDAKKCIIEGEFKIESYNLQNKFGEWDVDYEPTTIIRREVNANGKSRAFINDTPVNLSVLKELGNILIDVHSQHANTALGSAYFYYALLDSFAGIQNGVKDYRSQFNGWKKLQKELTELEEQQNKERLNAEFNQFQLNELKTAQIKENEQDELEKEFELLNNSEEIKSKVTEVTNAINYGQHNVADLLYNAEQALEKLSSINEDYLPLKERLSSALIELRDVAEEAEQMGQSVSNDAYRLQEIDERLGTLFSLVKKFGVVDSNGLLEKQTELEELVNLVTNGDEQLNVLRSQIEKEKQELLKAAAFISKKRSEAAKSIAKEVLGDLAQMGMEHAQLEVQLLEGELNNYGFNTVDFLFTANKGKGLQPVAKTASGGELSRLMLSLKRILSEQLALPTIVFDEIDTGVSGDIADKMGEIMQGMGSNMQVLAITHLPQIAAKGNEHFKVFKSHDGAVTSSKMKVLAREDRVNELAVMLSGSQVTEAAIANAKALLQE